MSDSNIGWINFKNNDEFLEIFSKIEDYLNKLLTDNTLPFPKLVDLACDKNPFIRSFTSELNDFSQIRNILAHKNRKEILIIPNKTLKRIKEIYEKISNTPNVSEKFSKKVYTCRMNDLLLRVLEEMKEKIYTHVPVYENEKFIGVLSEVSVTNWLASKNFIDLEKIKIMDIEDFLKKQPNEFFDFVKKDVNAYLIRERFYHEVKQGKRLGAVFITEDGNENGPLLGIITAWDLPLLD